MSASTFSAHVSRELYKLVAARITDLGEDLMTGLAIRSQEQYREVVGRISGLREALDMLNEAETNVNKK